MDSRLISGESASHPTSTARQSKRLFPDARSLRVSGEGLSNWGGVPSIAGRGELSTGEGKGREEKCSTSRAGSEKVTNFSTEEHLGE